MVKYDKEYIKNQDEVVILTSQINEKNINLSLQKKEMINLSLEICGDLNLSSISENMVDEILTFLDKTKQQIYSNKAIQFNENVAQHREVGLGQHLSQSISEEISRKQY